MKGKRGKPNLDALTGLRFFAALGVVVYHFALPAMHGWPSPLIHLAGSGFAAVSFFYVLSGFILSYSYLSDSGAVRGTRRAFWVSRFARIYPAYFLAFLLAAPTNILWSLRVNHLSAAIAKLTFSATALLSMLQSWTPWTAWAWNFPAWSVSVEAFFYAVFPFAAPRLARVSRRSILPVCAGLWVIALIAPLLLFVFKGVTGPPQLGSHLQMVVEFNPFLRLPEFLTGILLGRLFSTGSVMKHSSSISVAALAALLAITGWCTFIPHPLLASGLLIPVFGTLIFALAEGRGPLARILCWKPLVILGEASYGIYILQIAVSYLLQAPPPHSSLRTFGIYLAALIGISLLSWRFVEGPLRNWLRKKLAPPQAQAAPVLTANLHEATQPVQAR